MMRGGQSRQLVGERSRVDGTRRALEPTAPDIYKRATHDAATIAARHLGEPAAIDTYKLTRRAP